MRRPLERCTIIEGYDVQPVGMMAKMLFLQTAVVREAGAVEPTHDSPKAIIGRGRSEDRMVRAVMDQVRRVNERVRRKQYAGGIERWFIAGQKPYSCRPSAQGVGNRQPVRPGAEPSSQGAAHSTSRSGRLQRIDETCIVGGVYRRRGIDLSFTLQDFADDFTAGIERRQRVAFLEHVAQMRERRILDVRQLFGNF